MADCNSKLVNIHVATAILHYSVYTNSARNFDSFSGYFNESLCKYLSLALEEGTEEEVFSLYAGKQCSVYTSVCQGNT